MSIEENKSKVGWGSWRITQNYKDYKDKMTVDEFFRYTREQSLNRIKFLNLKEGDYISLEYICGNYDKVRKYKGFVQYANSYIRLKQKNRTVEFDIELIDEIKKLPTPIEKEQQKVKKNSKVVELNNYRREIEW
jgi:L-ribulose-5-phosphate 3-epimerase UlaE